MNSEFPKSRLNGDGRTYTFDRFSFIPGRQVLMEGERVVALPLKTCELLGVLVESSGEILTKDEIIDSVWKDTFVEESNLSHHVAALRKALGKRENGEPFVETIRRRGYRFVGDVKQTNHVTPPAEPPRTLAVESSGNIYSVTDWRREPPVRIEPAVEHPIYTGNRLAVTTLGAVLVAAALSFALYKLIFVGSESSATATAVPFSSSEVVRLTASGNVKLAAISPDGRYIAHVTEQAEGDTLYVRQTAVANDTRIYGPSDSELAWVEFAPDGNSLYFTRIARDKGEAELLRVPVLGGPAVVVHRDGGATSISPDGTKLAFMEMYNEDESRLVIAEADGSNEVFLVSRAEPEHLNVTWYSPSWSPDGKSLAFPVTQRDEQGRYATIMAIDLDTRTERKLTDQRWAAIGQPRWIMNELLIAASETSTGAKQLWNVSLADGVARRITRDLNSYDKLTLTADARQLAVIQRHVVSNVSIAKGEGFKSDKQMISEVGWLNDLMWMPDGRIAYISAAGGSSEVWIANSDGTNARQVTAGANVGLGLSISADGLQIIFAGERAGRSNLWRVDLDGSNPTQITFGEGEYFPQCTPDGRWIVYQSTLTSPSIWRVPTGGGEATKVSERGGRPSISPDGRSVAYNYLDGSFQVSRWSIGVSHIADAKRVRRFDFPSTVAVRTVKWSRDGRSIAFVNNVGGTSNIWQQPLDGGKQSPVTNFVSDGIEAFSWNTDGSALAIIRVERTSDAVKLSR